MKGSRCPRGHGTWWPARERCPACAGAVEPATLPTSGRVLAGTTAAGAHVALVALGDVVAPAVLEDPLADGQPAAVHVRDDGLLGARRAP